MSEHDLEVEVDGDLIVVSQLETQFVAIYRSSWQAANDKARELALIAEFENDIRRERQRDGINKAKAAGTRF